MIALNSIKKLFGMYTFGTVVIFVGKINIQ